MLLPISSWPPLPTTFESSSFARSYCMVWRVSLCLLGVQLVGMLVFTTVQYQRFNLTNDFAGYAQSWTAIAHGTHEPVFERVDGPFLAQRLRVTDVAPGAVLLGISARSNPVVAAGVCSGWRGARCPRVGAGRVKRRPQDKALAPLLLGLVAALLLLTPWSWYTIGFDFHFVPFATLFALLAARDLWAGRYRRSLVVVGSPYAAFGRRGWCPSCYWHRSGGPAEQEWVAPDRVAIAVVILGVGWLALAAGLGAMRFEGLHLSSMYGYLSGHPKGPFGLGERSRRPGSQPGRQRSTCSSLTSATYSATLSRLGS